METLKLYAVKTIDSYSGGCYLVVTTNEQKAVDIVKELYPYHPIEELAASDVQLIGTPLPYMEEGLLKNFTYYE